MDQVFTSIAAESSYQLGVPVVCDPLTSFDCLVSTSQQQQHDITPLVNIPPPNFHCHQEKWNQNDRIINHYWSSSSSQPNDDGGSRYNKYNLVDDYESHTPQFTYGEVTSLGVRQLAYEMDMYFANDNDNNNCDIREDNDDHEEKDDDNEAEIIFYDLGSGVGRLVTQLYIDNNEIISKAIGIELSKERHDLGMKALTRLIIGQQKQELDQYHNNNKDRVKLSYTNDVYDNDNNHNTNKNDIDNDTTNNNLYENNFPVQLIHGNVLDVDLLDSTTHVYISSLCFPEQVLVDLQEKLVLLPNLRVVAALNRLDLFYQMQDEWVERTTFIQMSWGAGIVKLYHKQGLQTHK